jgi:hypothetical protein
MGGAHGIALRSCFGPHLSLHCRRRHDVFGPAVCRGVGSLRARRQPGQYVRSTARQPDDIRPAASKQASSPPKVGRPRPSPSRRRVRSSPQRSPGLSSAHAGRLQRQAGRATAREEGEARAAAARAEVPVAGAWRIMRQRRMSAGIEQKTRGGCHVCLPNA